MNAFLMDAGILVLRLGAGGFMLFLHGWGKFMHYFDPQFDMSQWADPIGVGGALSHHLATFAEVVCALMIMLGILTRLSAVPLAITMAVAGFLVHADDPMKVKELAFLYLAAYVALIFTGGGKFSLLRSKTLVLS